MSPDITFSVAVRSTRKLRIFVEDLHRVTRRLARLVAFFNRLFAVPLVGCDGFAPFLPFASTNQGDMKNVDNGRPLLPLVLAITFASTTVLFAGLYIHEQKVLDRTQAALKVEDSSTEELKQNVQVAIIAQDKQDKIEAICGIYEYSQIEGAGREYDLRSDGTAIKLRESENAGFIRQGKNTEPWSLSGNMVTIGNMQFTIEGEDLIDSRGNRWMHER